MKNFTQLTEKVNIENLMLGEYKNLKLMLLNDINAVDLNDLNSKIILNIDSLQNNGKSTIMFLQSLNDKIDFAFENESTINKILEKDGFFNLTPAQNDIKSIKMWINDAVDIILLILFKQIQNDLK